MGNLAARSLPAARAAVTFVRDEHASIKALRGPKWATRLVTEEITRRVGLIAAAIPVATRKSTTGNQFIGPVCISAVPVTQRHGQCMCCGDLMAPHRGGQCELCERALVRALEARNVAV